MEKEFEVEVQETEPKYSQTKAKNQVQLPLNFLAFGEIEPDDVKVYIKQDIYQALEKYAVADVEHERGTILMGNFCEELGKTHVIISNEIEARYTDASASTLTFTHETWEYVYQEQSKRYPDKKIVGWQHTHPGYGIFLSNYDLFIQENFFNLPFQVAYVIDPVQKIRGFFQWKNGKIEKLKGYYIYDDVGKPIKIEQTKARKKEDALPAKPSKMALIPLAVLCFTTIVLLAFVVSLNQKYKRQLENQQSILGALTEQGNIIESQNGQITKLQEQLGTGGDETAKSGEIRLIAYTVAKGDTLLKICEARGIDYQTNIGMIQKVNGIKNTNQIYPGQTLLLPVGD